jgi:hypothetical protein
VDSCVDSRVDSCVDFLWSPQIEQTHVLIHKSTPKSMLIIVLIRALIFKESINVLIYRVDLYVDFPLIIALILAACFLTFFFQDFFVFFIFVFDLLRILLFSNADVDLDCG